MTSDMPDDLHHLAAAYSLDALDADERARFEAHLPRCETCRTELAELTATAGLLADATATPPPPDLKARVMAEVATMRQLPPEVGRRDVVELAARRRAPAPWLAAAAAAVVIVVGAVVVVAGRGGDGLDDHLAAADTVFAELAGPGGQDGAVLVAWSPERDRVALLARDLAPAGRGMVYELWAIAGGTPMPAGLFEPADGTISELVDIDDLDVEAWGITIEPAGGSPAPTGEILYYGEI